jgi:indolepyruvate ferredoxin oxidoreductase alpha subunit
LALAEGTIPKNLTTRSETTVGFQSEFMRWVVLPVNAVQYHERLHQRLADVQTRFENSPLNGMAGEGLYGVIACGFAYQKLLNLLNGTLPDELRILRLGIFHPLPKKLVSTFLEGVDQVLVLEENAPLIERETRNLAQKAGLELPIYGRDSGHLPWAGELFASQLAEALSRFAPSLELSTAEDANRAMPSKESPPGDCPYNTIFPTLLNTIKDTVGREAAIIVGDPGCMVRFQESHRLMDVKSSLGSSIAIASGIALSQAQEESSKQVIALSGDSGLLHSNLAGLMEAAQLRSNLLVLVLENQTTALSGGQPHPGSGLDARGMPKRSVELVELVKAVGVDAVEVIDATSGIDLRLAIERAMVREGVKVIFASGACPPCGTLR